jgi:phage baseplate assembly protein W
MATPFKVSRLGVEVNLPSGSTYDLLLVSTPEGYPEGKVYFKFEQTPRKITGVQKVAQTFMRILFSSKGSDVLRPDSGTAFPELVISSNRQMDDRILYSEISEAVRDAEQQTRYILNSSTEDFSSQLEKIIIQGFDSSLDSVTLFLRMVTRDGEEATVAIPFPELNLPLTTNK